MNGMNMIPDSMWPESAVYAGSKKWQFRDYMDRRFWHAYGLWGYGVTDDFGELVQTWRRPMEA